MNRTERRWKAGKRGRKALAAALAAGLLALSPLAGMEAHAASTDDLIIYGGGGGGGSCGESPGGGGGGYVKYGDLVQFAGGGNAQTGMSFTGHGGSVSGGTGTAHGGGVGLIAGGSWTGSPQGVGLGDGGKVQNANGNTGATLVDDPISDLNVTVTPGSNGALSNSGGAGGSASVVVPGLLELSNLSLYGGNAGDSIDIGFGPGGAGGAASLDASNRTVTLSGGLLVVSGMSGNYGNDVGGDASLTIGTLVASGDGTYTFGKHSGDLAVNIDTLELQADVALSFVGTADFDSSLSSTLSTLNFNGGSLTINDDANLDAKNITLASVSGGSSSQTLIQSTGGNLTGVVNVSTSMGNLVEWQVEHSGGTASIISAATSIDLSAYTGVTAIGVVLDPTVTPPNPDPTGSDSSAGGLASTGDANPALFIGVAALIAVAGVGLCVYGVKKRSQVNKS